ncbi:hypothetical protein NDN08_004666 [Rhodosorus marinus]|uniref:Cleavage/polyadenylation specificity factor A subunit N-terminal domain-containing protein n=1 Tax=Rhodosorus marinus TaxID=101924 RepID=A0AAV8UR29_9RHOD|nr:hypothetical protein NDN08_004666 [Rhodosorus marinus]
MEKGSVNVEKTAIDKEDGAFRGLSLAGGKLLVCFERWISVLKILEPDGVENEDLERLFSLSPPEDLDFQAAAICSSGVVLVKSVARDRLSGSFAAFSGDKAGGAIIRISLKVSEDEAESPTSEIHPGGFGSIAVSVRPEQNTVDVAVVTGAHAIEKFEFSADFRTLHGRHHFSFGDYSSRATGRVLGVCAQSETLVALTDLCIAAWRLDSRQLLFCQPFSKDGSCLRTMTWIGMALPAELENDSRSSSSTISPFTALAVLKMAAVQRNLIKFFWVSTGVLAEFATLTANLEEGDPISHIVFDGKRSIVFLAARSLTVLGSQQLKIKGSLPLGAGEGKPVSDAVAEDGVLVYAVEGSVQIVRLPF